MLVLAQVRARPRTQRGDALQRVRLSVITAGSTEHAVARFIPAMLIGLIAVGLLIGGVSPAWWITGLVAVGFVVVVALPGRLSVGGRSVTLAPYIPASFVGLVAIGLLIAGVSPAWWITGLVAIGFVLVVFMGTH